MNELERIVRDAAQLAGDQLLATVVKVSGSSYRRPGARMLVSGDRWLAGCVSGGCLEGDVMMRGAHRCKDGPVVVTYDSTADDEPFALGCNGIVDVLLEYIPAGAQNDALAFARACFAAETSGTLVTVIRGTHDIPVGARVAIGPAVELANPVRGPAARAALEALAHGPTGVTEAHGLTVLVEDIAPSPQLFVCGSGHDAAPVVTLAKSVGFRVTVVDRAIREPSRFLAADRTVATHGEWAKLAQLIAAAAEPYVVIMHHQVGADREAMRVALASHARYIGALGPAKRTREELLDELGVAGDPRLHSPIGLDVGAETPEQIALSIVGEVQAVSRRARGGMLRDRARALHADVATIVLAAGGSRRLGHPKQIVEVAGEPLVRRVASTCVALAAGPVGVVVGAHADRVAAALGSLRVARIDNPSWQDGIASSIKAGIAWARTTSANALVIALADQPLITAKHLAALRDAWLAGASIAASRFDGVVGPPALFDRARWDDLDKLEGDRGAASLLRAPEVAAIEWAGGAVDVDTPDDVRVLATI